MCPILRHSGAIIAAVFLTLFCGGAFAQATPAGAGQAYPVKPIRLVVPFPAGASSDIVSKLSLEVVKALGTPDLRERLQASGVDPWPGTPEQMAELLRTETARYAEIVRNAGLPRE